MPSEFTLDDFEEAPASEFSLSDFEEEPALRPEIGELRQAVTPPDLGAVPFEIGGVNAPTPSSEVFPVVPPEVSPKRAALEREMKKVRGQANLGKVEEIAQDVAGRILNTISQMNPADLFRKVVNPQGTVFVPPEEMKKVLYPAGGEFKPGSVSGAIADFITENASGMTSPDAIAALAAGKISPSLPARYFQTQMIPQSGQAVQKLTEAKTAAEGVKAGLETAATIGLPLLIEKGLAPKPSPIVPPITGRMLDVPEGAIPKETGPAGAQGGRLATAPPSELLTATPPKPASTPADIAKQLGLASGKEVPGDLWQFDVLDPKDNQPITFSVPKGSDAAAIDAAAKAKLAEFAGTPPLGETKRLTTATPADLEPALLVNGKPVSGGFNHEAIFKANFKPESPDAADWFMAQADDANHVFVDKSGNYYTRREAADLLKEKEPLTSERLRDMQKATPEPKPTEPAPAAESPKKQRLKVLKSEIQQLAKKGGLTAIEAARFRELNSEANSIRFELAKPLDVSKVGTPKERQSTIPTEIVSVARDDLMRNKDVYDPIIDAAIGVSHDAETSVDLVMAGQNPKVSAQQLYDAFNATREAMRKHYGDTITLFRAVGKQREKPTTNWATTREYAEQFGKNIVSKEVPIDNIIAVNVGISGKYHEVIVGERPTTKPPTPPTTTAKEPWEMTRNEWLANRVHEGEGLLRHPGTFEAVAETGIQLGPYFKTKAEGIAFLKQWHKDHPEGWDRHRDEVRNAIEEGKPVPPEVLADYPDLAKPTPAPAAEKKGEVPVFIGNATPGQVVEGRVVIANEKTKKAAQAIAADRTLAGKSPTVTGYLNGKHKRGWVVTLPEEKPTPPPRHTRVGCGG